MTYEEARERLEGTTDFRFQGEQVWIRDVGVLQAVAAIRDGEPHPTASAWQRPLTWSAPQPSAHGRAA